MKKKQNNKRNTALSVARYGILIAFALVLSFVESQIPFFTIIPGVKPGLTNIVVLTSLYRMGSKSAMALNIIRIVLVSLLFGGFSAMIYSLAGGMLSTVVMILLKKTDVFGITAVSIAGGISHNIGQLIVAAVILNTSGIMMYLSVLWFSGLISGALIGLLGSVLVRRLPENLFE